MDARPAADVPAAVHRWRGLLLLSIYGNAGLFLVTQPIVRVLAQLGSLVARGHGVRYETSNVGDTMAIWCAHLGWILVSLLITAVWTALDRRRRDYRSLAGLLLLLARFGLAVSMIVYGMAKVIPTQMGFMALPTYQLQLTGDTSLMGTLWGFMGASTPYSVATGSVELAAGLLLLWRRTTLLGSVIAVVAMTQVFLLNLCYDVPVKLVSGEMLLIALGLTSPYWRPLARLAFGLGPAQPVPLWPPAGAGRRWLRRTAATVKWLVAGGYLVGLAWVGVWAVIGMHSPQSGADGVWRATSVTVDGTEATVTTVPAPWVNVAVSTRRAGYAGLTSQTPSGYVTAWYLTVDGDRLELRERRTDPPTVLTFRLVGSDGMVLTGTLDGHRFVGHYERRAMQRAASHFRLIEPTPP
ncbi:hypothetical protein [Tsukamurella soli]|uniref:hypothetical protein n=1 Tax=Tsukamurella soli TaxID=644556 RepID=UPI00361560FF